MSHSVPSALPQPPTEATGARRRRCQPRRIAPGSPRPSDLLRAFFAAGLVGIAAAAVAGALFALSGGDSLHWLALHLLFVGGVSQLVLGAAQFFTCAFLATDPPPRNLVVAQLAVWNAGTVLVAVGVPTATSAPVRWWPCSWRRACRGPTEACSAPIWPSTSPGGSAPRSSGRCTPSSRR